LVIGLEAFKGHNADEYSFLIRPLSEFVYNNRFFNLPEIDRLARVILNEATQVNQAETTHAKTKPSVTTQFLADRIKPWIEDIRQTLFHSKSTPFDSIEDAQRWCDGAKKGIDEWYRRADEWHRRVDEWTKRKDEWGAHWQAIRKKYPLMMEGNKKWAALRKQGIPVDLPTRDELRQLDEIQLSLESLKPGESPKSDEQANIYAILWDKIIEVVKATGFTTASVKMHILANTPLVLPSLSYGIIDRTHSLPSGASIVNRFARVTIRSDLTFEDLRSAYRSIRRELGITRSKSHTTKHLQLYQMIRGRGRIPSRKGTVTFWKSVMGEWNNLHPQDKYKTWKGVKLAYDRIIAQLERRITTKGGTA